MQPLARFVSLLALCALTSLTACKDAGSNPPPAGSTPAADAPVADAPVADAPVAPPAAEPVQPPAQGGAAPAAPGVVCTPETRKGGICTREYRPVCGVMGDQARKTFSNKCVACSDEKVSSYVDGACPGEPTG